MSDLFQYTIPAHNVHTSKITGELLEDIKYSKLGATKISSKAVRAIGAVSRIYQEGIDYIETDWKEVALDFAQLGLTLIGLIEVAEPIQMGADLTNGAIDIKRGHPIIGAISMGAATPIVGLLGGIPLSIIRAFKCICSSLKFLGKSFIAFAVKPICAVGKFIWLRRGVLLTYSNKLQKFVENSAKNIVDDIPRISESLINHIKEFGEKLAKEKATIVNKSTTNNTPSILEQQLRTPFAHPSAEARKEVSKYILFKNSYTPIKRPQL